MVAFYVDKIQNHGWKLDRVPALWRKKVEAAFLGDLLQILPERDGAGCLKRV